MAKKKIRLNEFYKLNVFSETEPKGVSILGLKGLIGGSIIGNVVGVIVLGYSFVKNNFNKLKLINNKEMIVSAREHSAFPSINVLHASIDSVQYTGVTLLIMHFFNTYSLGLYSYAYRIIQAPLGIIVNSYAQVFFQKSAEMHANNTKLNTLYKKTLKVFAIVGLPIFLIFGFWGREIFCFIFGSQWGESGYYVQLLTPWFFMNFLFSPMGQLPLILNKQKQVFSISIIGNSLILLSIIIGGTLFKSIEMSFILISITQFFYYSFLFYWFNKITK
jgi:O-antigen/teichoic acid export membrane protein